MIEGNVALQVLAASTKTPRHFNPERNDDRSDDVILLALASGWPPATWRSLLARALYLASRADAFARRSTADSRSSARGRTSPPTSSDAGPVRRITAGLLAIEGAHALDDDPANVEVVADAGFRMMSPSHLFDTAFGGSAHGMTKGGLTPAGREMVERMEARGMIVDVAHASVATIDDVLSMARRPVVASHTGVRGTADNVRNLTDAHLRGIADDWRPRRDRLLAGGDRGRRRGRHRPGDPPRDQRRGGGPCRARLGLRWRRCPADRRQRHGPGSPPALLDAGFGEDEIAKVMGGNALRVLASSLPD